jgi:hypothetical protein
MLEIALPNPTVYNRFIECQYLIAGYCVVVKQETSNTELNYGMTTRTKTRNVTTTTAPRSHQIIRIAR